MNLSRAAKKFRTESPRHIHAKKKQPNETSKPVAVVEPPKPVAVVDLPKPVVAEPVEVSKPLPQSKRPRFVRAQTEKRQRVILPPLVSSKRPAARVLTKNVFLPPKESKVL